MIYYISAKLRYKIVVHQLLLNNNNLFKLYDLQMMISDFIKSTRFCC